MIIFLSVGGRTVRKVLLFESWLFFAILFMGELVHEAFPAMPDEDELRLPSAAACPPVEGRVWEDAPRNDSL